MHDQRELNFTPRPAPNKFDVHLHVHTHVYSSVTGRDLCLTFPPPVNEGQGVGGLARPRLEMSPRVTLTLMTSGNWRVTISLEGRLPTHEHQYSSRTRKQAARPSPSRGRVRRRLPGATATR